MIALTTWDKQSVVWTKIYTHCQERLVVLQKRLEGPLDLESTNRARGAISEIRAIIALNEDSARIEPEPPTGF